MKRVAAVALAGLLACSVASATPMGTKGVVAKGTGWWTVTVEVWISGSYDLDITVDGVTTSYSDQTDLVDVDYTFYVVAGDVVEVECWSNVGDYDLVLYDELGFVVDSSYSVSTYDYVSNIGSTSSGGCVPSSGGFAGLLVFLAPLAGAFILRRKIAPVAA